MVRKRCLVEEKTEKFFSGSALARMEPDAKRVESGVPTSQLSFFAL